MIGRRGPVVGFALSDGGVGGAKCRGAALCDVVYLRDDLPEKSR